MKTSLKYLLFSVGLIILCFLVLPIIFFFERDTKSSQDVTDVNGLSTTPDDDISADYNQRIPTPSELRND
jgi:hypothetical protein